MIVYNILEENGWFINQPLILKEESSRGEYFNAAEINRKN
jgi:hypothetical protein